MQLIVVDHCTEQSYTLSIPDADKSNAAMDDAEDPDLFLVAISFILGINF